MNPKHVSAGRLQLQRMGIALVLLTTAQAAFADAVPVCVTNDAQLVSALNLAQSTAVAVQLQQGTYHLNQTVWNAKLTPSSQAIFSDGSSLLGGYIDSACNTRNIDINNTVVTDTTTAPDDEFRMGGGATIEGITFKLANGLIISAHSIDQFEYASHYELLIRRNVFTQSTGASKQPIEVDWDENNISGGTLRFVDNLLHDNSGGGGPSNSAAIFVNLITGEPSIQLVNNTVVNNGGSLGGFGLLNLSTVPVFADNNIFYGNSGKDFAVFFGSQNTLIDNVIGTHSYAGTVSTSGNTTANPQLASNFRPIESPLSNVINSGTASTTGGLPTTDIQGRARQVGSAPDRGAYESTIDDSVIQSVTTNADSGVGSLRSAILSANGNAATLIVFNLGSNCPYTINLQTPLPNITASMTIAGYSQAGSSPNDLESGFDAVTCVILDGTANNISDGLYVPAGTGDSVQMVVSGLAFSGFTHGAISLYGGSAHNVTGIRIGGIASGTTLNPVGNGIIIGPGVHDVKIGDGNSATDVDERNVIGEATGGGIVLDGAGGTSVAAHDNQITNNYIGVGWNTAALGGDGDFTNRGNGGAGVTIAGYNNTVQSNYIEYNGGYGVELTNTDANNNTITDNNIGYMGSYTDQGSGNHGGVLIENDAHDNDIVANSIWFNLGTGIRVLTGQGNELYENQLWSNVGLGIDLAAAGVTLNDNDTDSQPADYANRGLNFPVITGAIGGHTKGTFSGTLTTAPGTYYINLFVSGACDPSGYGEAQFPLGGATVMATMVGADGQATASFSIQNSYSEELAEYPYITAIALDTANNTSEIAQCVLYTDDTIFADSFEN